MYHIENRLTAIMDNLNQGHAIRVQLAFLTSTWLLSLDLYSYHRWVKTKAIHKAKAATTQYKLNVQALQWDRHEAVSLLKQKKLEYSVIVEDFY